MALRQSSSKPEGAEGKVSVPDLKEHILPTNHTAYKGFRSNVHRTGDLLWPQEEIHCKTTHLYISLEMLASSKTT